MGGPHLTSATVPLGQRAPDGTYCRFWETQYQAQCALHTVRNVLSAAGLDLKELPGPKDMDTMAEMIAGAVGGDVREHKRKNGWWSHTVVQKVLDVNGVDTMDYKGIAR